MTERFIGKAQGDADRSRAAVELQPHEPHNFFFFFCEPCCRMPWTEVTFLLKVSATGQHKLYPQYFQSTVSKVP